MAQIIRAFNRNCRYCNNVLVTRTLTTAPEFKRMNPAIMCPYCDEPSEAHLGAIKDPDLTPPKDKSLRCTWCDRAWPAMAEFMVCPLCREVTVPSMSPALSIHEADELSRSAHFGWYLWDEAML